MPSSNHRGQAAIVPWSLSCRYLHEGVSCRRGHAVVVMKLSTCRRLLAFVVTSWSTSGRSRQAVVIVPLSSGRCLHVVVAFMLSASPLSAPARISRIARQPTSTSGLSSHRRFGLHGAWLRVDAVSSGSASGRRQKP